MTRKGVSMATHRFQRSAIWTAFAALTLAGCGAEQVSTPPAPQPPVVAPGAAAPPAAPQSAGPLSAQGKDWQYIVNNATRPAAINPHSEGAREREFSLHLRAAVALLASSRARLMLKSSHSPGCIRRSPASHCCQFRSEACTSAPACVCVIPAASRAARISAGGGLRAGLARLRFGWLVTLR